MPLVWIVPLALYLASFVLTFGDARWYRRGTAFIVFVCTTATMLAGLFQTRTASLRVQIPALATGFFICAIVCHRELYQLRPSSHWLTWFYLSVSVGGAMGGVCAGLVAPMVFNDYTELPVALLFTVVVFGIALGDDGTLFRSPRVRPLEFAVLALLVVGCGFAATSGQNSGMARCILMARNFYGAVRVYEYPETSQTEPLRELVYGKVNHGSEYMRPRYHRRPTGYYSPASGVGIALADRPGKRTVGVIGLGTGTLAAYARPGDRYRFYEINPLVLEIAKSYFFFLKECPGQCSVVLGDGRLALEHEPPSQFDVLAVDAFFGGSVPVHLLTVEAFRQYFYVLKPTGVLVIHVSNNYLKLDEVVAAAAHALMKAAAMITTVRDQNAGTLPSKWIVLANDPAILERPEWNVPSSKPLPDAAASWTDDFSNVIGVLRSSSY